VFTGGSATLNSGASLPAANSTVSGSGTGVTLGETLTYAGTFSAGSGATLNLSGGNLTLTGTDSFAGATTSGSHVLNAKGTISVAGLTIGGTATFNDIGTLIENGGSVTVGDSLGDVAKLSIASTGTWDILDKSGIGHGLSTASSISNSGLLEKTPGTGTRGMSVIAPKVTNSGTILVSSGTLDIKGAVTGGTAATPGIGTISGASILEFDSTVASKTTLGSQDIGFTGGGTLDLTDPKGFWGEISGFAASDTIELLGSWSFVKLAENSAQTLGTLTLTNGGTKHAFEFVGDFAAASFSIEASGSNTLIT
jgi:hypothetical protein